MTQNIHTLEKQFAPTIVLAIFILWSIFLSFEFWGFGESSYVKIPDAGDSMLASLIAARSNLQDNEAGDWNPNLLGGVDRASQGESLGLIDSFFLILPGWLAYGLLMFLQRFIAGFFTHRLLTRHLGVSPVFALSAGLFFALFSQNQINLQFDGFTVYDGLGSPALPLIIYSLGELAKSTARSFYLPLLLSFGVGALASASSNFVLTVFFLPLIAGWFVFVRPRSNFALLVFFAFTAGWGLFESKEFLAAFLLSPASQRTLRSSCTGVNVFTDLASFFRTYVITPVNLVPFVIGCIGLAVSRNNSDRQNILAVAALFATFIAAAYYLPTWVCSPSNPIGFIKGFNYSRFYFYFPFLIAVLAGLGLQNIYAFLARSLSLAAAAKASLIILAAFIFLILGVAVSVKQRTFEARADGSNYANLFMNPYLLFLSDLEAQENFGSRSVVLFDVNSAFMFHPSFLWPYGVNTLDGYTGIYSLRFSQYWQLVIYPLMSHYPDCRYGLKYVEGNNRSYLSNQCELAQEVGIGIIDPLFDMELLSLMGVRYFVSTTPLSSGYLTPIDTTGVTCTSLIPGCTKLFLYKNAQAFPGIFALSAFTREQNPEKLYQRLAAADLPTLLEKAFVVSSDVEGLPLGSISESSSIITVGESTAAHIRVSFSSALPKLLVVNMTYSPDWAVYIDRMPSRVIPIDLLMTGVYVPSGVHEIEFLYSPKHSFVYWWRRLLK